MKNRSSISLMIKLVILLLALIVMVFVATFTWFMDAEAPAKASGLSVSAKGETEFDIAIGFSTSQTNGNYTVSEYSKSLDLTDLEVFTGDRSDPEQVNDKTYYDHYNIFYDFSPLDVTGNGVTLVRPNLINKNSQIDPNSKSYGDVDPNQDYISFDMILRANEACTLYLDTGSKALGAIEAQGGTLHNGSDINPTTDYSVDAIVGALRVAFTDYAQYTDTNLTATEPNALWIPRSDFRYAELNNIGYLYHGIDSDANMDAGYQIPGVDDVLMNTYKHHYYKYNLKKNADGETVVDSAEYTDYNNAYTIVEEDIEQYKKAVCTIDEDGGDDYYYGKVKVNIWLEGCDSEARRALKGGEFIINLDITTKDSEDTSVTE